MQKSRKHHDGNAESSSRLFAHLASLALLSTRVLLSAAAFSSVRPPTYSGYWLKKYRYPKSVLDSAVVKFRPIQGTWIFSTNNHCRIPQRIAAQSNLGIRRLPGPYGTGRNRTDGMADLSESTKRRMDASSSAVVPFPSLLRLSENLTPVRAEERAGG